MPDQATPEPSTATASEPAVAEAPTDFREFVRWRETGEPPEKKEPTAQEPSAAAEERAPQEGEPEPPATTAPDSEPEDSQETAEEAAKRPGSRQRRIDRLTRENAELLRRLEALEQKAAPPPPAPVPPAVAGKPDLKDFTTLEAYAEALTEWKLDQREAQRKADDEKRAAETAAQALQDSWAAKEKAAAKAHPDYRELMEGTEIPVGPGVLAARQALLEDEHGAEILYWLASRPAELRKIAALSPARAVLEIGKLAMSFEALASPDPTKPKISNAPKPPSPITHGAGKVSDSVDDPGVQKDFKRWKAAREAQLRR